MSHRMGYNVSKENQYLITIGYIIFFEHHRDEFINEKGELQ